VFFLKHFYKENTPAIDKINGYPAGQGVRIVVEPTGEIVQVSSTLKSVG